MKFLAITSVSALLAAGVAQAQILAVDFGSVGPETGFQLQDAASVTHTTSEGDITVDSGGSFFARSGSFSNADFFRDFTFQNNGATGFDITLSGPGILADTQYELRFWGFDPNSSNTVTIANTLAGFTSESVTIDDPGGTSPSSLGDFTGSTNYTSDGAGSITVSVTALSGQEGPRINGLEVVSVVPEPSAFALLAGMFGLTWVMLRRRS